jgi:hypothetical protein
MLIFTEFYRSNMRMVIKFFFLLNILQKLPWRIPVSITSGTFHWFNWYIDIQLIFFRISLDEGEKWSDHIRATYFCTFCIRFVIPKPYLWFAYSEKVCGFSVLEVLVLVLMILDAYNFSSALRSIKMSNWISSDLEYFHLRKKSIP